MTCDRYVILTDRTPLDHAALDQWGVAPCDLAILAKQTTAAQEAIMAAFAEHAAKPGKADLMEPTLLPVPSPGRVWCPRRRCHAPGTLAAYRARQNGITLPTRGGRQC
jgi:hypothetical protein